MRNARRIANGSSLVLMAFLVFAGILPLLEMLSDDGFSVEIELKSEETDGEEKQEQEEKAEKAEKNWRSVWSSVLMMRMAGFSACDFEIRKVHPAPYIERPSPPPDLI